VTAGLTISSQCGESAAAIRTEAEDGEVVVKGSHAIDTESSHDGEARSIDERKSWSR